MELQRASFLGFLLGSAEGIAIGEKKKAVFSGLIGLAGGIIGGAISFFLASYLLVLITNTYNVDLENTIVWVMPITRSGGWGGHWNGPGFNRRFPQPFHDPALSLVSSVACSAA
jgi:hypothetical protein